MVMGKHRIDDYKNEAKSMTISMTMLLGGCGVMCIAQ
jgi:hypothetical protein